MDTHRSHCVSLKRAMVTDADADAAAAAADDDDAEGAPSSGATSSTSARWSYSETAPYLHTTRTGARTHAHGE